jgi:hypothetical protein
MRKDEQGETQFIHYFILEIEPVRYLVIDHINGNGLDNRQENLRVVSYRVNLLNTDRSRTAKGIERHGKKWRVRPFINGVRVNLGSFSTEEEARLVWEKSRAL